MFKKLKPYIISIAIPLVIGGLSALITSGSMEVYSSINRPALAPPPILFPIVWSILYILMGISAALIYKSKSPEKALCIYAAQLVINFFWSIIFFNFRAYLFSFIWLIFLIIAVIFMLAEFKKINSLAAYLQIPYLLWIVFASYLNLMIFLLN